MYLFYSLIISLLFLALLPYFIYNAFRHGKYSGSLKERMGWLPDSIKGSAQPTIWIHAVSVGELNAARPLILRLGREMPDHRLVISTTTLTGQTLARAAFDHVFFFPFDWSFAVRRALAHVNPAAVIILETELWPNFLRECRRRGVETIVVNGRISPRSFARYMRVRPFISRVLADISLLLMQSDDDARRVLTLGADGRRVRICGNLKYDIQVPPAGQTDRAGSHATSRLIMAGSTAPGEEAMILEALRLVHAEFKDVGLILAPRHPERFKEVEGLLEQSVFYNLRRSDSDGIEPLIRLMHATLRRKGPLLTIPRDSSEECLPTISIRILLLDTIGELAEAYRFADVVFVGGSLVPRGGHNIIEPAAFARPIIVGPHTENFRQIISDFKEASAVVQLDEADAASLAREFIRLLSEPDLARAMGARARNILLKNQGATPCAVAAIQEIMIGAAGENL